MPRLRPATSQTPNAEEQKKAAAIAAAAEAERLKKEAEANGENEEEIEVEIEAEEDDNGNEALTALQKQIEELKKSEQIQRDLAQQAMREREEALKRSREREVQVRSHMKEATQAKLDAINSSIATAKAEAAAAERDIEAATQIGDIKASAEAYRRLARAEANLGRLEDGKAQAEEQVKAEEEAAKIAPKNDDPIDKMDVPDSIKSWLRSHPDYLADQRKNAKLQAFHWDVLDEGHAFGSDAYIESMETHLGIRKPPAKKPDPEEEESEDRSGGNGRIVSAPVSRDAPNAAGQRTGGSIRLNAAQREAAKNAGISEAEYAKQLKKLQEMRANGSYDGER